MALQSQATNLKKKRHSNPLGCVGKDQEAVSVDPIQISGEEGHVF